MCLDYLYIIPTGPRTIRISLSYRRASQMQRKYKYSKTWCNNVVIFPCNRSPGIVRVDGGHNFAFVIAINPKLLYDNFQSENIKIKVNI